MLMLKRLKPTAFPDDKGYHEQRADDAPNNDHLGLSISDWLVLSHEITNNMLFNEARCKTCLVDEGLLR